MDLRKTTDRVKKLFALVDGRVISPASRKAYHAQFRRMWDNGDLDPLKPGIALDTYYHRRASLHFAGCSMLLEKLRACADAIEKEDRAELRRSAYSLLDAVDRLEPMFALDPPAPPNVLPWELPPSRWHASENADRERGANSKRKLLPLLPRDWDSQMWLTAPDDASYRDALAVLLTVPVRSEELVPNKRPTGWSPGVVIELQSPSRMSISHMPAKSHGGKYGTELTRFIVDFTIAEEPARYLAQRCKDNAGRLVVSVDSKNALRKAMTRHGRRTMPALQGNITPNVARHQLLADLKRTFGAGEIVAAAGGHGVDRTQSHYGFHQQGRKRRGYVEVFAARTPRCGSVEHARSLSAKALDRKQRASTFKSS
ncbi:hypothetical protein V1281_005484 [Nitrobacteraceae bacterium AZCC 2161]